MLSLSDEKVINQTSSRSDQVGRNEIIDVGAEWKKRKLTP